MTVVLNGSYLSIEKTSVYIYLLLSLGNEMTYLIANGHARTGNVVFFCLKNAVRKILYRKWTGFLVLYPGFTK